MINRRIIIIVSFISLIPALFVGIGRVYKPTKLPSGQDAHVEYKGTATTTARSDAIPGSADAGQRIEIIYLATPRHDGSTNTIYATMGGAVYCLAASDDGSHVPKILPGINADKVSALTQSVIKDDSAIFGVKFCSQNSEPEIDRFVPKDTSSFSVFTETNEGSIFIDKYAAYARLPQEFSIEIIDYIDRDSLKFLGYGKDRSIELIEGMLATTTDAYFSDQGGIYVMRYGRLVNLGTSTDFSIPQYENDQALENRARSL